MRITSRLLLILGIVAAALGGLYLFDFFHARSFDVEIESVSPQPAYAGESEVEIVVRISRNGKPMQNHSLYVFAKGSGSFFSYREMTDETGRAVFKFFPNRSTILMPARDIEIQVIDESNSVFFEVNAKESFILNVVEPPEEEY